MSSIVPPLDKVPKIPIDALTKVGMQLNKSVDRLISDTTRFVSSVTKLPKNCSCDDPRISRAKKQLADIQKQIVALQAAIPKIQKTVDNIKTAVEIANKVRMAITAAQLLNPVTAGLFLAQQTMLIQETVIVNALGSLSMFATIPASLTAKLAMLVPTLMQSIQQIGQVCNGDVNPLQVGKAVTDQVRSAKLINNDDVLLDNDSKWNELLPTEFYTDYNVSETDISDRASIIESYADELLLIDTEVERINLLQESILEAPSQVYRGQGTPSDDLGKLGDYYVDESTNEIYGPKLDTSWSLIK